jgi:hypothetical protein
MTLDETLEGIGLGLEGILVLVLVGRRFYRTLPAFSSYIVWSLFADLASTLIAHNQPALFLRVYPIQLTLDVLFRCVVLADVCRVLALQNRASLPRPATALFLFSLAALLLWRFSHWGVAPELSVYGVFLVRLQQASSVWMLAAVLALIWWSSLYHLNWPKGALRIATGLGFNALVALTVALIHTRQSVGPNYHLLDVAAAGSYLGVLAYWVVAFS